MRVKPAEGRMVRYPRAPYALLPAEGGNVPDGEMYWMRRLRDGDVELVEEAVHERSVPRRRETE